ncbi:MAG: prenyltransferase/squalene oxidase repeat-containing protein [Candidatus Bathyarchaeia archaeon]
MTRLDVQKAVRFVEENGTELEKYRLNYLLGKERDDEVPQRYLRGLQNDDGGFPYNDEKGKVSSVNFTSVNLSLMIELGLTKSDVCRKTLEYLMQVQSEDGSWDENQAINQYNPPFWNMPGDLKAKMWLTASVTNYLIQLGYRESEAVRRATLFLLKNRNEEGTFFGFLHSTWISAAVFGQLKGVDSEVVKKALKVIERNISRMEDGASDFVWCLECFHVAGVSKDNPLVKRCIARVTELQKENGAWASGDGEKYAVSNTINALRVLRMYEVW